MDGRIVKLMDGWMDGWMAYVTSSWNSLKPFQFEKSFRDGRAVILLQKELKFLFFTKKKLSWKNTMNDSSPVGENGVQTI